MGKFVQQTIFFFCLAVMRLDRVVNFLFLIRPDRL